MKALLIKFFCQLCFSFTMVSQRGYEAASADEHLSEKNFNFTFKFLVVIIKSVILSVPEFFKWLLVPMQPKNVKGQLALVTGGSNGIGKAVAMRLAQEGCNIAIANRNHVEGERTAKEIREKFNVKVEAFKVDVSKVDEVLKLRTDVQSSMGNVDILVNNAGLLALNISVLEGTPQDIQNIIDVNLTSYFWVRP